jgi:hypothetical protein
MTLGTYDPLRPKWWGVAFGTTHNKDLRGKIKPHQQIVVYLNNYSVDTKKFVPASYVEGEVVTVVDGKFAKTDATNNYPAGIVEKVKPDYLRIFIINK